MLERSRRASCVLDLLAARAPRPRGSRRGRLGRGSVSVCGRRGGGLAAARAGGRSSSSPQAASSEGAERRGGGTRRRRIAGGRIDIRRVPLTPLAARYDHVLLDLDGCVWVGEDATPRRRRRRSTRCARRARASRSSPTTPATRPRTSSASCGGSGFRASLEEVVTVGGALQHVLNERHAGRQRVRHRRAGGPPPRRRRRAARRQRDDVRARAPTSSSSPATSASTTTSCAIATQARAARRASHRRRAATRRSRCPTARGPAPGAVLAALETRDRARRRETVGKPEPQLFLTALDRLGADAARALVVGDRLDADVGGRRTRPGSTARSS